MDALTDSLALVRQIQAFKKDHPVRAEVTGTRSLDMSQYIRQHCRPSKTGCVHGGVELGGFVPIDLDWIVHDYHHKLLQLIEVKTRGGRVGFSQSQTLGLLDIWIRAGVHALAGANSGYVYLGLHTLVLQNTTPINSTWRKWDGENVTAEECWRRLNMIDAIAKKLPPTAAAKSLQDAA